VSGIRGRGKIKSISLACCFILDFLLCYPASLYRHYQHLSQAQGIALAVRG
jgi:hypothetical protein